MNHYATLSGSHTAVTMRIIAFLLDSGVKVAQQDQPSQEYSCDSILWRYRWNLHDCQEEYISIMERLIDSGLRIRAPAFNPNARGRSRYDDYWDIGWKDNLRLILAIDDEGEKALLFPFALDFP